MGPVDWACYYTHLRCNTQLVIPLWFTVFSFVACLALSVVTVMYHYTLRHLNIHGGQYGYMTALMQLSQPQSAQQPTATDWPPCPTPVNVLVLSRFLATHPDRQFTHYIHQGLLYGFRVDAVVQSLLLIPEPPVIPCQQAGCIFIHR